MANLDLQFRPAAPSITARAKAVTSFVKEILLDGTTPTKSGEDILAATQRRLEARQAVDRLLR